MNKKFFAAVSFAVISALTVPTFAQKPENCKGTQNCATKQCEKAPDKCPFDNLNLNDTQKQQLKALQQERKAAKEQAKENKDKARKDARDRNKQGRAEYLAKIKAILSPEQYVQFLENNFTFKGHGDMHKGHKKMNRKADGQRKGQNKGYRHHDAKAKAENTQK